MNNRTLKIIEAVEKFELDYKETLNQSDLDPKTICVLYDLGADIKHMMDAIINALND